MQQRSTPATKKGNKALKKERAHNKENQNKKARSDDKGSGEEDSKQVRTGSEEKGGRQGVFVVDLELMNALMKKTGSGTQAAKKKAAAKKKEDSVDKTKGRKKKATFAEPDKAGKKEDANKVEACNRCIVGFAIRVDKENNTKGGFNKMFVEGLAFLQEYLDEAACILPSGKDPQLGPIKSKADIPGYQVVMKNYFSIPNPIAFSNVTQHGGRVIKGSASMGFSLNPKECLDDAVGDL